MIDPVEFAEARLDEDDDKTRDAARGAPPPWVEDKSRIVDADGDTVIFDEYRWGGSVFAHIARYDPGRARREIEAGRRILARHGGDHLCPGPQDPNWLTFEAGQPVTRVYPCGDMRDLLFRWAAHPDYEESWRP